MPYSSDPLQLEGDDFVCGEHVGDPFLASLIVEYLDDDPDGGDVCAFCTSQGMPVENLVEVVSASVNKFFDRANDAGIPFENGDWQLPVMSTEEVLADIGIDGDSPLLNTSCEEVDDDAWVPIGYGWPDKRLLLQSGWRRFSEHLKHRSRFLFETVESENEYGAVESLGTRDFLDKLLKAVLQRQPRLALDESTVIYRARAFDERDDWPKLVNDYTSPPDHLAAQGRMNPAGISYFYGALDSTTAAVEVFDGSAYAGVASFHPMRKLRLVDLTNAKIPSPFDDSVTLTAHHETLFLHRFTQEIARVIVRDGRIHQEYIPTQAVTEYIRFRSRARIDGVAFSSSRAAGTNIVVFANQELCLGPGTPGALLGPGGDVEVVEYGAPAVKTLGANPLTS